MKWTEKDFQAYFSAIQAKDYRTLASYLLDQSHYPTGDPRVLSHLEQLLTVLDIVQYHTPYQYGEVRLLAARALAAERIVQNIDQIVEVTLPYPLGTSGIFNLLKENNLDPGMLSSFEEEYKLLVQKGYVKTFTLRIDPKEERKRL